ncbi:ArsR/SmtB family transcription factor [Ectobacillus sp. sgz5001026]|uniref:ArsR/SmtB family transcription factor n=1 Tax=Ectobacillus sp. sgz5001026 TaxID=3242473 RepID=UPI0036D26E95
MAEIKEEKCMKTVIHKDVIHKVKQSMPSDTDQRAVAELFKVLGDYTRMRILTALMADEMCVCDLACMLSMTQSAISHQLRVLKQAKLVKNRRDGKVVYYSLADDHVIAITNQAFIHVNE